MVCSIYHFYAEASLPDIQQLRQDNDIIVMVAVSWLVDCLKRGKLSFGHDRLPTQMQPPMT